MKKISLIALALLMIFSSCRKNVDDEMSVEIPYTPPTIEDFVPIIIPTQASLIGFVVDEDANPVSLATITLGDNTTMTDEYGHFFFNDIEMNQRGTLVKIEKEGYFDGSRRFFPSTQTKNRVKVELLEKSFDQSFDANSGATITIENGSTVTFKANSIRTEAGEAYSGEVQVAAKWMDPTQTKTFDQMPGNLQGVNELNQEVALQTYGMVAVELQSPSGEALNIQEDQTATLSMDIPQSLLVSAPQEIPLWSYNEDFGLWQVEGTAQLQNGKYVGEVSHFSFWNCDFPGELVEINLTIVDEATQSPRPYTGVRIVVVDGSSTGWGYTDEEGQLTGLVPANEELMLEVIGLCGEVVYSEAIGPFTEDADLGSIAVMLEESTVTISGSIECDGTPIEGDAVVLVTFDGFTVHHYTSDGTINVSTTVCTQPSEITVTAVDLETLNQSETQTIAFVEPLNVGTINTCNGGTVEDLISITHNGETRLYPLPTISTYPAGGGYVSYETDVSFIGFDFYGSAPGNYGGPNGNQIEVFSDGDWEFSGYFETFELEEYGAVGEKVKGNFTNIVGWQGSGTTELTGFFITTRTQ